MGERAVSSADGETICRVVRVSNGGRAGVQSCEVHFYYYKLDKTKGKSMGRCDAMRCGASPDRVELGQAREADAGTALGRA